MAARVQNGATLTFTSGGAAAQITASQFRLVDGSTEVLAWKNLTAEIVVNAGDPLTVEEGDIDVVYPSGDLTDAHIEEMVTAVYTGGTGVTVQLGTGSAVISDSNYSNQTTTDWDISTESD